MGEQLRCHSGAGRNQKYVIPSPEMNWTPACAEVTKLPVLGCTVFHRLKQPISSAPELLSRWNKVTNNEEIGGQIIDDLFNDGVVDAIEGNKQKTRFPEWKAGFVCSCSFG